MPNEPLPDEPTARTDSLQSNESPTDSAAADSFTDSLQADATPVIPLADFVLPTASEHVGAASVFSAAENLGNDATVDATGGVSQPFANIGPPMLSDAMQIATVPSSSESAAVPMVPNLSLASVPPVEFVPESASTPASSVMQTLELSGAEPVSVSHLSAFNPPGHLNLDTGNPGLFKIGPSEPDQATASTVDVPSAPLSELQELHAAVRPPHLGTITVNYSQAPPMAPAGGAETSPSGDGSSSRKPVTNLSINLQASMLNVAQFTRQALDEEAATISKSVDERVTSAINHAEFKRQRYERANSK